MAKVRITKELDSRNMQYFKLTKKRGKITDREAFEAMEESYYFGEYLIRFNVPEEAPMDLYEDGDEWRLYAVKELLEEEIYKAHQEGYEECKKDFNFEKTANNGWIPCSERMPEEEKDYLCCYEYTEIGSTHEGEKFKDYGVFYHDGYKWIKYWERINKKNIQVVAWQPLPELYREEQEYDN